MKSAFLLINIAFMMLICNPNKQKNVAPCFVLRANRSLIDITMAYITVRSLLISAVYKTYFVKRFNKNVRTLTLWSVDLKVCFNLVPRIPAFSWLRMTSWPMNSNKAFVFLNGQFYQKPRRLLFFKYKYPPMRISILISTWSIYS
jgi:hypothetical protein